jgi:glycine/sarcosine N-methyltransferase
MCARRKRLSVNQVPLYDALAADYDRFVDWKGRLSRELPFFSRLFDRHGVRRVLDAACGTGHHAIALAQQGYQVVGADLSPAMVERARDNASAAGVDVVFAVAGLGDLAALGVFDAAICLGNSLPHVLTAEAVACALADFAAVLRPGGLLVIQNRNFDRVWVERQRFMSPQSHRDGDEEWLFLRFYDFHGETVTFNMIRLQRREGEWVQVVESTELRPIFRDDLALALAGAGFGRVVFYGGYGGSAYDPAHSGDLIAVATRT